MTRLSRTRAAWLVLGLLGAGCGKEPSAELAVTEAPVRAPAAPTPSPDELAAEAAKKALDAEFPLHGLVTGLQLKVRKEPDPSATVIGWLRMGSRIRLAQEATKTPSCASGFYRLHPRGYACAGEGIRVEDSPPDSPIAVVPPARDAALPYSYYHVREDKAPEYHRLPSRDEQRAVADYVARLRELEAAKEAAKNSRKRSAPQAEPKKPELVRRLLQRGFFVASTGLETRAERNFVRTVRGAYVKQADLDARSGSSFRGVVLDETQKLPVAWAVRAGQSFVVKVSEDGALRMVPDEGSQKYERLARVPWVKRERVGDQIFHKLEDGRYLKAWYVAVAEAIARPPEIKQNEPWVHVNLERQTLVAYRGDTPVYATLVSTGLPGHPTPTGVFSIRSKHVSATMSDVGPDVSADQRYSIEDVPWTQYFSGSVALHGAFWHAGYGLPHSHGCVNLAPLDAHHLFDHTWPEVPDGFHGVTTDGSGLVGSKVYITEK